MACHQSTRLSINNLLVHHSLPPNVARHTDVYKENARFWARRPLTKGKRFLSRFAESLGQRMPLSPGPLYERCGTWQTPHCSVFSSREGKTGREGKTLFSARGTPYLPLHGRHPVFPYLLSGLHAPRDLLGYTASGCLGLSPNVLPSPALTLSAVPHLSFPRSSPQNPT